ncbi:hypothetical protein CBS101457_002192 [Exobasidium rhododendri]|nr:hypothetical protein CBS101457_002192 [Exobasidium rhododendri]
MVIKRGRGRGGRGGGSRGGKRGEGNNRDTQAREDKFGEPAAKIQNNKAFEAYYLDQQIIPQEEWQSFMTHLRSPLPTSFRITSGKATTNVLLDQMKNYYLPFLSNVQFEGEAIPPPQALPWYPENMGWQIDVKKSALRKTEQFKKFQHFLVHETEVGNISRQESVSMIPPLFLDVQPHHIVLDMCAAPGSKTAQLIEGLHSPLTTSAETYDPCPAGMVIANDSDAKRAHMLIHQSQRLPSPNLIVANYDASAWPTIKVPYMANNSTEVEERPMLFDRILADVPCSGDGTLRKNLMIWKDWHPFNGASLHPLQLRILLRGLLNLRNGGRLVYSTCSMNPTENEAVIAAALRESGGTVSLVDQSAHYPELKRRKGLTTWKVLATNGKPNLNKQGDKDDEVSLQDGSSTEEKSYRQGLPKLPYVDRWEDLDVSFRDKVPKTQWPAGDEETLHLDRCMRIYPHDQNTGGFFVAVLEKRVEGEEVIEEGMAKGMIRAQEKLNAEEDTARLSRKRALSPATTEATEPPSKRLKEGEKSTTETTTEISASPSQVEPSTKKKDEKRVTMAAGIPYREDPMAYVAVDDEQIQSIVSFFAFKDSFNPRNLLVRNAEARPMRSIYLTSTSARALISSGGPGKGQHPYGNPLKLRLLNCGIRAFARQESGKDVRLQCKWRVLSDGLPAMRPLIQESNVVKATMSDFVFLLSNHYPKLEDLPEGPFKESVLSLEMGSHFCDVAAGEWNSHTLQRDICVPLWRAGASLNLMLDRQEKSALSFRIFGSDLSNSTGERQFANLTKKQRVHNSIASGNANGSENGVGSSSKDEEALLDEDALQELENAAAIAE